MTKMDQSTFEALQRVIWVVAALHNRPHPDGIAYEDLQRIIVWIDNTKNMLRHPDHSACMFDHDHTKSGCEYHD